MLSVDVQNKSLAGAPEKNGPSRFEVFLLLLPLIRQTVFLRRIGGAYTAIDAFAVFDIAAMFLVGFYLFCVLYRFPWHKLFGSCMGWCFLYYVFCNFSFLWRLEGSSAPFIIYRAASMTVMILYIFYLMSRFQAGAAAFDGLLRYVFYILLFGMIGAVKGGGFSLAMLHTNSYSFSAAVLAALALTAVKSRERTFSQVKWYLILGFIGVILGTSTGSNIAFAMALCFVFCVGKEKVDSLLVMLLPIIGVLIYEFFLPELVQFLAPGKTVEGLRSGTGRMRLWEVYIDAWRQRPWLGYGFSIGERAAGQVLGFHYTLSAWWLRAFARSWWSSWRFRIRRCCGVISSSSSSSMNSRHSSSVSGCTEIRRMASSEADAFRMFVTCFALQTFTTRSPGRAFCPQIWPA